MKNRIIEAVLKEIRIAKSYLVYHGSPVSFNKFDLAYLGTTSGTTPSNMSGFFFSDSEKVAKSFGKNLIRANIELKNPKIVNAGGKDYSAFKHKLNDIVEKIDRTKYDGIIIKNYVDYGVNYKRLDEKELEKPSTQFIVFSPNQIKII